MFKIKLLQSPTLRYLTTQPIIAHVELLQKIQCGQAHGNAPGYLVVIQIQRCQALGELHFGKIKCQQVPRNVKHLRRFVGPEKHGGIAFQFVP
ncbi:hypothetical protein CR513_15033, partial [Mucuna pruriens]